MSRALVEVVLVKKWAGHPVGAELTVDALRAETLISGRLARGADEPFWPLKMSPESYLARFPEGEHAGTARKLISGANNSNEEG